MDEFLDVTSDWIEYEGIGIWNDLFVHRMIILLLWVLMFSITNLTKFTGASF